MNFNFPKLELCAVAAFGLALICTFSACGDENTTEVIETTGLSTIAAGEAMPECSFENDGDMVYVADSAAVYYCVEGKWSVLNGKNGEKGDRGTKGDDGKGSSCSAKSIKEGVEISCAGVVVDTLTNGKSIKGDKGYSCSVKQNEAKNVTTITCETENGDVSYEIKDGEPGSGCEATQDNEGKITVSCGGKVVGTLENGKSAYELAKEKDENVGDVATWLKSLNGESCSATEKKDEQGKVVGYDLTCGDKAIGTISNGNDGTGCNISDEGNGVVNVTCGSSDPIVLYKAMCGTKSYEPAKSFCVEKVIYALCGADDYNPVTQFCYGAKVYDKCGTEDYNPTTHFCYEGEKYALCGTEDYNPSTQFCYGVKVYDKCSMEDYNPTVQYCHKEVLYNKDDGYSKKNNSLLDFRDMHVYKTTTIGDKIWMAQNLNYAYVDERLKYKHEFNKITYTADSTSWCYNNEVTGCNLGGRLYTWSAAMDSLGIVDENGAGKGCGYGKRCEISKAVRGVCPSGWHLPSKAEWESLVYYRGQEGSKTIGTYLKSDEGWNVDEKGNDVYGFSALPVGRWYYTLGSTDLGSLTYFWSATQSSNVGDAWVVLLTSSSTAAEITNYEVANGNSVRCLKDSESTDSN